MGAVLVQSASDFEERQFGNRVVREKGADPAIGFSGLSLVQDLAAAEVGLRSHRIQVKRGYAFEAAASIIHYAFHVVGLGAIVGITDTPHLWPWRLLENLEMHEFQPPSGPDLYFAKLARPERVAG